MKAHPDTDPITADQARQNESTRGQWGFYDAHRRAIERLIVPVHRGARICILGAGNCNDLDLPWLVESYREVHLVDLDGASLQAALTKQKVTGDSRIHLHAPVDLTGIADRVASWRDRPPDENALAAASELMLQPDAWDWGKFDVVLSPCVLTQMMNPVRDILRDRFAPSHPARAAIRAALRARHLRTIAALLAPGGRGVLVIDLISTEKFADLPRVPCDELHGLMRKFISDGKCYPGLDPTSICDAWERDRQLRMIVEAPGHSAPWMWHLGLRKSFVVYAATFVRKSTGNADLPIGILS